MSGLKDSELLGAPASSRPNPPEHKEWFSRGYLPHFDLPDLLQSITFRLADSLPQTILDEMTRELADYPEARRQRERERSIAAYLDIGHGACWLKNSRIVAVVENALLHFDGRRYGLLAWCVMPNHVHALVETKEGFPLPKIVHSWKSFTGNEANKILGRSGDFWQREYHDRFIRDDEHYRNAVVYIENNPVKAGLVTTAEAWRYSSAWSPEKKGTSRSCVGRLGRSLAESRGDSPVSPRFPDYLDAGEEGSRVDFVARCAASPLTPLAHV